MNLDMTCIEEYRSETKGRIQFNFSYVTMDERKYLAEIMNYRSFKLLHRYVIANGDVLVCYCLLEPIQARPSLLKRVNGQLLRGAIANGFKDELALGRGFLAVNG